MPGIYGNADFDLAGFAVGAVERGAELPAGVRAGDRLLGLASDGVHSNGYSLVRKVVERTGLAWDDPAPFADMTLGKALLAPTRIYVRAALAAVGSGGVHGIAHITGGGLAENVPRSLPAGMGAAVDLASWALPPVFGWLLRVGEIAEAELLKTFNAGIGMVLAVAPDFEDAVMAALEGAGERVYRIGMVEPGQGLRVSGYLS